MPTKFYIGCGLKSTLDIIFMIGGNLMIPQAEFLSDCTRQHMLDFNFIFGCHVFIAVHGTDISRGGRGARGT